MPIITGLCPYAFLVNKVSKLEEVKEANRGPIRYPFTTLQILTLL